MNSLKIGVKFCGNCNPRISGRKLLTELQELLPEAVWLPADSLEKELLLVLSGCTVDCATRPTWSGPILIVAGESVDSQYCPANQLADNVKAKIKQQQVLGNRE